MLVNFVSLPTEIKIMIPENNFLQKLWTSWGHPGGILGTTPYEPREEKTYPTRSDTNRAVQPKKMARGLHLWI